MAFYNRDGEAAQAQEVREEAAAAAMNRDPDIRNAMRGIFSGKYADLAKTLPVAWDAKTRNIQVARSIADDKGFNHSGVTYNGREWKAANTGTPLAVQLAPYVIGGVAAAGAGGAFGGAGGTANTAGGLAGTGEASVTGPISAAQAGYTGASSLAGATGAGSAAAAGGGAANTATNTAANTAKTGGGSWLTGKYADLATTGIQAIGGLIGANISANAAEKGLAQQQAQFDAALAAEKEQQDYDRSTAAELKDYTRNQYGSYLGRLEPYADTGYEANERLGAFMGRPNASAGTHVPAVAPVRPAPLQTPAAATGPAAGLTGEPAVTTPPTAAPTTPSSVRMRAPDGSEQDVPAAQVAHYQSLGATVLGNRYHTMAAGSV